MKKLIITNLFTPYNRGGAERVVEQQVQQEIEQGNEVIIYTAQPWHEAGFWMKTKQQGALMLKVVTPLNIYFYTSDHKHHPIIRFFWHIIDTCNLHTLVVLIYILRKENPDVIHTHNLKGIGYLLPLAIRFSHITWIHTVHDIQLLTPSGLMLLGQENHWQHIGIMTRMYRAITSALFGSPHQVIFPSQWCMNMHENYYFFRSSNKIVQKNKPDPVFFSHPYEEKQANRYAYAGQLEPHKGIHALIDDAIKHPENEYHVYGDGSLRNYVESIAAKHSHIFVYGSVDKKTLALALAQSQYFIYPSLAYENCPMAILEAQAAGCTIFAPEYGGIPELLH